MQSDGYCSIVHSEGHISLIIRNDDVQSSENRIRLKTKHPQRKHLNSQSMARGPRSFLSGNLKRKMLSKLLTSCNNERDAPKNVISMTFFLEKY